MCPVGQVGSHGCRVDLFDCGSVRCWVGGAVLLQEPRDSGLEGGLQEGDTRSRPRVLGDQGVGGVGRPKRARQELGAEYAQVIREREGGGFRVEVLDVRFEQRTGGYAEGLVLNTLQPVHIGPACSREPDRCSV